MKRLFAIIGILILCLLINFVPAFAIQTGFYNGEAMVHLLGAEYQVELMGIGDDAIALFDTRDMYWYMESGYFSTFYSSETSFNAPDCYVANSIEVDASSGVIFNDIVFSIDYPEFPTADTIATTYMKSDRFRLASGSRLGLHLNPIYNYDTDEYLRPSGSILQGQVTAYALTTDGDILEYVDARDDLVVGSTYDITSLFENLSEGQQIEYYWCEYNGVAVIPSFVHDIQFIEGIPRSSVQVIDYPTAISYPVSYQNFNLLEWISTAVDGFMRAPLFVLGDFTVTISAVLAVGIAVPIFVAFLRRYAGG